MRRLILLFATLALIVPVSVVGAGPAAASTGSLTITTLGRDGHAVSASVRVVRVEGTRQYLRHYHLTSGHLRRIANGTYDALVDIRSGDGSDTLAARRVRVDGATRITIDARQGRALRTRLRPAAPAGDDHQLIAAVCQIPGDVSIHSHPDGGLVYVIPSSLSTVQMAYSTTWQPADESRPGPRFVAAPPHPLRGLRAGTATFRQSKLATLTVRLHRGPQSGSAGVDLDRNEDTTCPTDAGVKVIGNLPYSVVAHIAPGTWSVQVLGTDYDAESTPVYRAGRRYRVEINRAVWGPTGDLPFILGGSPSRLLLDPIQMFADPTLHNAVPAVTTYVLRKAGRTVLRRTVRDTSSGISPILRSAGWYTLTASATRKISGPVPADLLSTGSGLRLHFYAGLSRTAQVRAYVTQFMPRGLDTRDRAKPGTRTVVDLRPQRARPWTFLDVRQLPDSVRAVRAWMSMNGGHTWRALRVRHVGSRWLTSVPNVRAGFVTLRSTVTDTHRSSSTTRVVRAYAVG